MTFMSHDIEVSEIQAYIVATTYKNAHNEEKREVLRDFRECVYTQRLATLQKEDGVTIEKATLSCRNEICDPFNAQVDAHNAGSDLFLGHAECMYND